LCVIKKKYGLPYDHSGIYIDSIMYTSGFVMYYKCIRCSKYDSFRM